jgi:uncharacterized membrane protein (DUF485 family)
MDVAVRDRPATESCARAGLPILRAVKDELHRVVARRWRVGAALTAVMMAAYFGFILLVAFDKDTAGSLLADGRVSLGIVLGALVIMLAPVLTAIYVRWANRSYDAAIAKLRADRDGDGA